MNLDEYMAFFDRWINYQFPRAEDEQANSLILQEVARLVADPDDCAYWSGRDCWSMYDLAKQNLKGA